MNKANRLEELMDELLETFVAKNKDYGDSFADSFKEFGITSAVVRMNDKMNRIKSLSKGKDRQVKDESLRDSLMDLANYALMTVVEIEIDSDKIKQPDLEESKNSKPGEIVEVDDRIKWLEDGKKYYLRAFLSGIDVDESYLNLDPYDSGYVLADKTNLTSSQTEFTKDEIRNLVRNWDVDLDDFEIKEVEDEQ